MSPHPIGILLLALAGLVAFILFTVFVLVPLFRGIGWTITAIFRGVGWFICHIFEFIGGMIGDTIRFAGAILAMVVLAPLAVGTVIIGRWSAAGHYADSVKREFIVGSGCLYRVLLRRPLKLFWLHGLLEGLEERVPEAVYAAPTSDKPGRRIGQFEGYEIVGSLPGGGSGGKLYIARPDERKRTRLTGRPEHVVIKSFALTEGSSLPQIVRESRALEAAKQLGHVLDHGMDELRFFYVMPYHPGDHLSIITRHLHAQGDGRGLARRQLTQAMGYIGDLLATLTLYHEHGLWHKDVKPENIIVHDGRAHLVDLGLVTPLKSAMTLTTHGTEYFRDPEMVRQALRGVKVHQVDGTKFDIYAAGAVLYFMLENTFPAHGGLSRFTHESPEALRWIVRRAMTDYNKRYASARLMLADLEYVAKAGDSFAVKPAELPSMSGSGGEEAGDDVDVAVVTATESPQVEQVAAAAGSPRMREAEPASVAAEPQRRPRLRVANWWTGEYVVEDPGSADAVQPGGSVYPPWQAAPVAAPAMGRAFGGFRRTAAEQLRAARARAVEIRSRAAAGRHKAGVERQPSATLVLSLLVGLFMIAGLVFVGSTLWSAAMDAHAQVKAEVGPSVENAVNAESGRNTRASRLRDSRARNPVPTQPPSLRVVLAEGEYGDVMQHEAAVREVVNRYSRSYHVVAGAWPSPDPTRELITRWMAEPTDEVRDELEAMLENYGLFGLLYIERTHGGRWQETLIRSNDPDASRRRWVPLAERAPAPEKPYLIVNDHPLKSDDRVQRRVRQTMADYEASGWAFVSDGPTEVAARAALPPGPIELAEGTAMLGRVLHDRGLGGLLVIYAHAGEGPAHERIAVRTLSAPDIGEEE